MPHPRQMSLTPDLVALCFRKEENLGYGNEWVPLTEAEQDAIAQRLLAELGTEPLWVFAYGSLIWNPTFVHVEDRRATAIGWHRSFCMELTAWRGTPEQPGLMMALDRGGRCDGVAFRLPDDTRLDDLIKMVRREIIFQEDLNMVRWIHVRTEAGKVRALVFWAGPKHGDGIILKLPLDKVAFVLARACGYAGSCAEYLYNTVSHLEALGIRDRNLWRLQQLVAKEIVEAYGMPPEKA
ncbi:MAG: cation transporter ChaC-like protein [Rhizobium sp.]|nr:cation transporter ChaC-like protein [Rhizobium sp.]